MNQLPELLSGVRHILRLATPGGGILRRRPMIAPILRAGPSILRCGTDSLRRSPRRRRLLHQRRRDGDGPRRNRDVHARAAYRGADRAGGFGTGRSWRWGFVGFVIGLEDQDHPLAFHLVVALDLGALPELGLDLGEDVAAEVDVGELAASELEGELDLVALLEELAGVVDLDLKVVVADLHGLHLDFFELTAANAGAGLVGFLLLLVAPLPVVHDLTDGRAGVGGDFDEVEPQLAGAPKGFGGGRGTDFIVVLVDQKNR